MSTRTRTWIVGVALVVLTACTGSAESAVDQGGAATRRESDDPAVVPMPAATEVTPPATVAPTVTRSDAGGSQEPSAGVTAAVIDTDGQLGLVREGEVGNDWLKFDAFVSPDRSTAVMTLPPEFLVSVRPVMWASLPDGAAIGEQTMSNGSELTATSLDGTFAGFSTLAEEPLAGAIAGARVTSDIEIISRDAGLVFRQRLDGNFVPEAFSSRLTTAGLPALVFLLEYFPADAPRFYRVRVLSTETGDVSLPLNLRNKSEQVDERMAGFSRSQVVAADHGLLFTLYRGTIDGTPDGELYAFVHTLDFADGVWCLDVDPRLELDRLAGSLAVGGDRLYVASANGMVGSFRIPSISDPALSPSMEWAVEAAAPTDGSAPVITADHEAAYVVDAGRPGFLARVDPDGHALNPTRMFGDEPTAFAWDDGALHAVGDHWATFGHFERPEWLDEITQLVVAS